MISLKPLLFLVLPLLVACSDGGVAAEGESPSNVPLVDGDSLTTLRKACVDFTNEKRATEGTAALALWTEASDCSDQQAEEDSKADSPHGHFGSCGEGAQNTCPNWSATADTASQRKTLLSCLTRMWDEGPGEPYSAHGHYINMSNTKYTKVTCGFYYSNGNLWVNQNFR